MRKVRSLIVNRFEMFDAQDSGLNLIRNALTSNPYRESNNLGFEDILESDNVIKGSLLRRTPSYIQDYDDENKTLVRRVINVFTSFNFSIDVELRLVYCEGGVSNMNALKAAFRNTFSFEYSMESILFSPKNLFDKFIQENIQFSVNQIVIKSFNYKNGIIGRFHGVVNRQSAVSDILNEYPTEILKISFDLEISSGELLVLQSYSNGNLKYLSSEEDSEYYLDLLKKLLFS